MSTARPLNEPGRPQHTLGRGEDSTGPGGGCRNGVRPLQGTSAIQPRPLVTTPRREDAPCHGSVGRLQNHSPARRPDRARPTPDRPRPLPLGTSRAPPLPHPAGSPALDTHRASPAPLNSASRQPLSTPSSRASSSLLPAPDDAGPLDAPLGRELAAAPRKANTSPARSTRAQPPRSAPQLPACCAGGRPGRTLVARTARHVGGRPC